MVLVLVLASTFLVHSCLTSRLFSMPRCICSLLVSRHSSLLVLLLHLLGSHLTYICLRACSSGANISFNGWHLSCITCSCFSYISCVGLVDHKGRRDESTNHGNDGIMGSWDNWTMGWADRTYLFVVIFVLQIYMFPLLTLYALHHCSLTGTYDPRLLLNFDLWASSLVFLALHTRSFAQWRMHGNLGWIDILCMIDYMHRRNGMGPGGN